MSFDLWAERNIHVISSFRTRFLNGRFWEVQLLGLLSDVEKGGKEKEYKESSPNSCDERLRLMWRGGLKGWDETRTERQWCCTGMTNSWGIFPACSFGKPRQYRQQTPVSQHHVSWRFIPPLMGWFLNKNYCEVHAFSFKSWHLNMDVCNFFHRSLVI